MRWRQILRKHGRHLVVVPVTQDEDFFLVPMVRWVRIFDDEWTPKPIRVLAGRMGVPPISASLLYLLVLSYQTDSRGPRYYVPGTHK